MAKRARSPSPPHASTGNAIKRARTASISTDRKVATSSAAAAVDAQPPLSILLAELGNLAQPPVHGDAVIYWMRMEDMRVIDNRALAQASEKAKKDDVPLVTLFIISPQDYRAHDRSARRIDFTLRNLADIQATLKLLHIPLFVTTHTPRRTIPARVVDICRDWNVTNLFANIEYEVDELRRDIDVCKLARDGRIRAHFLHDKLIVPPGQLATKQGKPYTVYSPFQRSWLALLNSNLDWLSEAPMPSPNDETIHASSVFGPLFATAVPDHVPGFECADVSLMSGIWPAGSNAAKEVLDRFLRTKSRSAQLGAVDPFSEGTEESTKHSRALAYRDNRDRADRDTSSRISPYLSAGVISARGCVREAMKLLGVKNVQASRDTGVGMWVQELAWRDFYTHVMAAFPRVSMGRPFQEKFDSVKWESNEAHLKAWKEGKTGVPIVDAGMRQLAQMGWMHNRLRMVTAMYLTKDLMLDWRLGERHFMESLIDGDLGSNNGGWQWSASTGTDPQPYFRIFNPYSQSEKADPSGDYIRHFVPELAKLHGPDVHKPSPALATKLGYHLPLVDHSEARQRALRRYKNPGQE